MAEAPTSAKTAQRAARKAAYQAEKQRNRVLETIARAEGVSDAASLVSGLNVTGFGAALIGSLIYSVLQLAIEFVLERLFSDK